MNINVLWIKNTFAVVVLLNLLAILTINCKHYYNTTVSIVTAKSTTFEVNLLYNIAQILLLNAIAATSYKLLQI